MTESTSKRHLRLVDNSALFARVDPVARARYGTFTAMRRKSGERIDAVRWTHMRQHYTYPTTGELVALSELLDIPYDELASLSDPRTGCHDDDDEAHAA